MFTVDRVSGLKVHSSIPRNLKSGGRESSGPIMGTSVGFQPPSLTLRSSQSYHSGLWVTALGRRQDGPRGSTQASPKTQNQQDMTETDWALL